MHALTGAAPPLAAGPQPQPGWQQVADDAVHSAFQAASQEASGDLQTIQVWLDMCNMLTEAGRGGGGVAGRGCLSGEERASINQFMFITNLALRCRWRWGSISCGRTLPR